MEKAKELLEYLVRAIVDRPDDVSVETTNDERGILLTLKVAKEDMGQVIGKEGQTARALRTFIRIVGARERSIISVKIFDPIGTYRPRQTSPTDESNSDSNSTLGIQ